MRKDTRASVDEAAITPIAQCGSELSIYNDIRVLISAKYEIITLQLRPCPGSTLLFVVM